jgi:hypothetical protein
MPFDVLLIKSKKSKDNEKEERKLVGTFLLGPSTACGDLLELGDTGTFRVKRVRFLYKYDGRKLRVFKKKIDVVAVKSPWNSPDLGLDSVDDVLQ